MGVEEKKIKYYAIDSVDVLHKLGSAGGGDPWCVRFSGSPLGISYLEC